MAEKEFLGDRRRKEEEEYFRKREQVLIDNLRQRAREEATRRDMAERTGVADQEILRDLGALGYTPESPCRHADAVISLALCWAARRPPRWSSPPCRCSSWGRTRWLSRPPLRSRSARRCAPATGSTLARCTVSSWTSSSRRW